ncbi:Astacin-like protease, partial [Leptotrombidium deliense]
MQKDCVRDSAMKHELCHANGFGHENQRPDALNYIIIHKENIKQGYYEANYQPYSGDYYWTQNLPYDYWSIMHYPSYAYTTRWDLKSMTARDGTDL